VWFGLPGANGRAYSRREKLLLTLAEQDCVLEGVDGLRYVLGPAGSPGEYALKRVEDRNGNRIELVRQDQRLTAIVDSAGRRLPVTCDEEHRIVRIDAPDPDRPGQVRPLVSFAYSPEGDLAEVRDALGSPFRYQYRDHLLVAETDRNGMTFHFEYDGTGPGARCTRTWGTGDLFARRLTYDLAASRTTVLDSRGHQTVYEWNAQGLVTATVDALGHRQTVVWDEFGDRVAETNACGETTRYDYDDLGRLVAVTDPLGKRREFAYDSAGNVTSLIDEGGAVWKRSYDAARNVTGGVAPDGSRWVCQVDRRGLPVLVTDALGQATRLEWDGAGTLRRVVDRSGAETRFTHDLLGRLTCRANAAGETRFGWDLKGRLAEMTDPAGRVARFRYDGENNMVGVTDPLGQARRYEYTFRGRLTAIHDPVGGPTRLRYDTEGCVAAVQDSRGREWTLERDALGNIIGERTFEGRRLRYERDGAGRLRAITNSQGQQTTLELNAGGRLTRRIYHDGTEESFTYDGLGRLVKACNPVAEVNFTYDPVGRLLAESLNGEVVKNTYDPGGNRVERTSPFGRTVQMGYDGEGRLQTITDPAGLLLSIVYDAAGREARRVLPGEVVCERQYNPSGQLLTSRTQRRGSSLLKRTYRYDATGHLEELEDSTFGATRFQHDANGRLIAAAFPERSVERFLYDAAGNVPSVPTALEARTGQVCEVDGWRLRYDGDGQLVEKAGAAGHYAYRYDAAGRLAQVVKDGQAVTRFAYDALGRRTQKKTETRTVQFYWDGYQPIGERARGPRGPEGELEYLFRPGRWEALAVLGKDGACLIETDHLGTPRSATDRRGEVVWQASYRGFGGIRREVGRPGSVPFRFPGQYEDRETGLYYNGFRYYDPELRQYLTTDPLGIAAGVNLWNYVSSPVAWIDPYGLNGSKVGSPSDIPGDTVIHRIGGNDPSNLALKPAEAQLDPPGISSLQGGTPQEAAQQMRTALPKATGLHEASKTVGSSTAQQIRDAGFEVVPNPTKKLGDNHVRITHPDGEAGFHPENLKKLSAAFKNTGGC
jgi:RHS repeat-associated protein